MHAYLSSLHKHATKTTASAAEGALLDLSTHKRRPKYKTATVQTCIHTYIHRPQAENPQAKSNRISTFFGVPACMYVVCMYVTYAKKTRQDRQPGMCYVFIYDLFFHLLREYYTHLYLARSVRRKSTRRILLYRPVVLDVTAGHERHSLFDRKHLHANTSDPPTTHQSTRTTNNSLQLTANRTP